DVLISDRLYWNGNNYEWSWQWCVELSIDEEQQLRDLKDLLRSFSIHPDRPDRWCWLPGPMGMFYVKSYYYWLLQSSNISVLDCNVLKAIQKLWKNDVPTKINIFGWRLLLEKLPTRVALNRRGILLNPHDLPCIFYFRASEDCSHLFFHCSFVTRVWEAVYRWVGQDVSSNMEGWNHFIDG
ncbi:putative ribonuclease H protein, partial [Trifolium medium]|nr:putative ribonuclease H protein [Trifolium medium]